MSGGKQSVTWRITSQLETMAPNASGQYVRGVHVTFSTDTGLVGSVFVPNQQYNPGMVAEMIAQRVKQMVAVHNLNGTVS